MKSIRKNFPPSTPIQGEEKERLYFNYTVLNLIKIPDQVAC
jgi:hypothetical protein